ncbi:MAG: AAA family ATPase [Lachnospiraceae bacterium]|nr:AAA family ATPase [Lachnospiraceae bacterium]MBO5144521.1 AAA family ATPase [Lachnospiraceae bacterium]
MRTISIINLKGGVGKTVTSINMAYQLMQRGSRVLLVDCDKQGNTSKFMKCHSYDKKSLSDILTGTENIGEVIVPGISGAMGYIDVIPANMTLLAADRRVMLDTTKPQQTRIRSALEQIREDYTFCIIDCAPDINISVINALAASDDVIIPVTIDKFAFDGIKEILEQIDDVRRYYNPRLNFAGCLITSYRDNEFNNDGVETLKAMCSRVFDTKIKWTQMVSASVFVSEPVSVYSPRCGASKGYAKFVDEYERGLASDEHDRRAANG